MNLKILINYIYLIVILCLDIELGSLRYLEAEKNELFRYKMPRRENVTFQRRWIGRVKILPYIHVCVDGCILNFNLYSYRRMHCLVEVICFGHLFYWFDFFFQKCLKTMP